MLAHELFLIAGLERSNFSSEARMAITKEQIFAVTDELDANGQNPTLVAVRKAVGGSFTRRAYAGRACPG